MIATRAVASAGIAAVLLAAPTLASAQPAPVRDPAAAEALFERGKQLVDRGKTVEACDAFAESERLDPAGGTLLRLALCHETLGKLASAWVEFTEVVRVSREGSGEPAKLQERVRLAQEHLASIGPRVPKLVVAVAAPARVDGLRVTANGSPREAGTWGLPLPVDPGSVTVAASAPGRAPFQSTVQLAEGQQQTVDIPVLGSATPLAIPPPAAPAAPPSSGSFPWRPTGIVVGALGIVALGVGTYFGVHAIGKWNDANASCPGSNCASPSGVSSASDAVSAARVADATIAGGAAAVVVGVVLYIVGAPPAVEPRAGGVAVRF